MFQSIESSPYVIGPARRSVRGLNLLDYYS